MFWNFALLDNSFIIICSLFVFVFEWFQLFEYIRIVFEIPNNICIHIRFIFRKRILFVFVFVSKLLFAPTLHRSSLDLHRSTLDLRGSRPGLPIRSLKSRKKIKKWLILLCSTCYRSKCKAVVNFCIINYFLSCKFPVHIHWSLPTAHCGDDQHVTSQTWGERFYGYETGSKAPVRGELYHRENCIKRNGQQ